VERFRSLLDVADIALVAFVFYHVLLLVRGTRAAQMFFGLAVLMVTSVAGSMLGLDGLNWIVSNLKTVWVIAFVILFQPELRRALASLGAHRVLRNFIRTDGAEPIGEIVNAVARLAEQGLGALIVLEREAELRHYEETGTRIESRVTSELLETIFTPPTPLHDGAVIVRGNQLVAAGCILPLTSNPRLASTLGTRHRAALGIAEETDAVVIVVSEETRTISLAMDGRLRLRLDPLTLRTELAGIFVIQPKKRAA
jgi:diadenylate cyclase